jgi:hypothetical protein
MVACRLAVASGASGANYPCVRTWSSDSVHRIPCVLHMLAAMRGVDCVVTCGAARVLWVSAVRCCIVWCAGARIRRVLARGRIGSVAERLDVCDRCVPPGTSVCWHCGGQGRRRVRLRCRDFGIREVRCCVCGADWRTVGDCVQAVCAVARRLVCTDVCSVHRTWR